MKKESGTLIALAGQPNCGKSTIFNALTGARQSVANWPGVTVDRMSGWCRIKGRRAEIVDLPGTYGLTSSSPEERVTRDFLLSSDLSLVVNVVDASNLRKGLSLTLQLLEMGVPLLVDLNMIDAATKQGISIDAAVLERSLGVPVAETSMKTGQGRANLLRVISARLDEAPAAEGLKIDYGDLEPALEELERMLSLKWEAGSGSSLRWMAVKLMEGDAEAESLLRRMNRDVEDIAVFARHSRKVFEEGLGETPEIYIGRARHHAAGILAGACTKRSRPAGPSLSDRIDSVVCHRFAGPAILVAVMYLLYYLSIVQGYRLTAYTWPWLARLRDLVEAVTPAPGFIEIPLTRSFPLWFTDSVNALLNYIPIFFILFGLIAILEDSGYMPRMAFIMDRVLRRFGLHGQSILPMVLGGVYVGGCSVPAVMSSKGIPDERSRLATILTIPLLNCLAKVPLYILLINAYFVAHRGLAMFFIATVSLLVVLPVAKVLSLTVLRTRETAPFVMEMPAYHIPTVRGVLGKAVERLWLFLRKITTIVAAVAAVVFMLLQFPGLDAWRKAHYESEKDRLAESFLSAMKGNPYGVVIENGDLMPLILYWDAYRKARMAAKGQEATSSVNRRFERRNPLFYRIAQPGGDAEAMKANRALRNLVRGRERILADMRQERLESSLLGQLGKGLEPFTRWAGFDWRVNVALLSSLAAKENSVATLGAIYEQGEGQTSLEERISAEGTGLTPLHALALMVFMVLYPPCIATAIAVKVQTNSVRWMLFSFLYPVFLGLASATLIFSLGGVLGASGIQAMTAFYGLALTLTLVAGFMRREDRKEAQLPSLPETAPALRLSGGWKAREE
jgi:ferrous iron transport protein B